MERCAHEEGKTDRDGFAGAVAIDGDTIVVGAAGPRTRRTGHRRRLRVPARPGRVRRRELSARLAVATSSPRSCRASAAPWRSTARPRRLARLGSTSRPGPTRAPPTASSATPTMVEAAKIVAGDGLARETFGAADALDGDDVIVGASGHELGQAQSTSAAAAPGCSAGAGLPPTGALVDDGVFAGPQGVLLGAVAAGLPNRCRSGSSRCRHRPSRCPPR